MSFDAQQEEQRAAQFLTQGRIEDALKSYKALLRKDSKSRRLRKTVADLSMRLGNKREAEQLMLTIAETDVKDKQYRMAIPIYRELIKMRPKDHEMHLEIAHCMIESNFESDALIHLKKAVEMTQRREPAVAQEIQFRIVEMCPGELSERRTYAELLESANWSDKASDAWKEFAEFNRKIGQTKEAARSIERALKNRDHWETRLEAAQCRFESKEPRKALEHLQQVYKDFPTDPKVLALLATGLQMVGHDAKAKQLWLESGKRYEDAVKKSMAFEEALSCGATEEELPEDIASIQRMAKANVLRLHRQPWSRAGAKVEERFVIKTRLLLEFKRYEDALGCIQGAEGLEKRPSIFALLVESLVHTDAVEEAVELLQNFKHKDPQVLEDVQLRLLGLGMSEEDSEELIDDDLLDDDLEDLDSIEELDSVEDSSGQQIDSVNSAPMGKGEDQTQDTTSHLMTQAMTLHAQGQLEPALEMLNQILELDPTHMGALEKMGVWALESAPAPTMPSENPFVSEPFSGGTEQGSADPFAALNTDPFADLGMDTGFSASSTNSVGLSSSGVQETDGDILLYPEFEMVYKYLKIGFVKEAESALTSMNSLASAVLLARMRIEKEQYRNALNDLQDAMDAHGPQDTVYTEALWELARIYSLQQRTRNTVRTLDEIADIAPTYRVREIELWREALSLLD